MGQNKIKIKGKIGQYENDSFLFLYKQYSYILHNFKMNKKQTNKKIKPKNGEEDFFSKFKVKTGQIF